MPELPMRSAARNTTAASAARTRRLRRDARSALFIGLPSRLTPVLTQGVLASWNLLQNATLARRVGIPGRPRGAKLTAARSVWQTLTSSMSDLIDSDGFRTNV